MTRNHPIEHVATVLGVCGDVVEVELIVQSACASCHARQACTASESTQKCVQIATPEAHLYRVGDSVVVSIEHNMGVKALFWAYVMPFFVLLGVLVLVVCCGESEGVAALCSIGAVFCYYVVLYLFRRTIEKQINFKIQKR
jgi:sigma-E factor negative regulatory protein RseC